VNGDTAGYKGAALAGVAVRWLTFAFDISARITGRAEAAKADNQLAVAATFPCAPHQDHSQPDHRNRQRPVDFSHQQRDFQAVSKA
jgi:hypothetical protein